MFLISQAIAMDWVVDAAGRGDFTSIQDALDAAADGDTVYVRDGTYTEGRLEDAAYEGFVLEFNTSVSVIGESVEGVQVDGWMDPSPRSTTLFFHGGAYDITVAQMTITNHSPGTESGAWWGEAVDYAGVQTMRAHEEGELRDGEPTSDLLPTSGSILLERLVLAFPADHDKVLLYHNSADVDLTLVNLTVDFATTPGDVTYLRDETDVALLMNSILSNTNGDGRVGGEVAVGPQIDTPYNDFFGSATAWGTGTIVDDPTFAPGGYTLDTGSPAIDAGDPDAAYNDEDGTRNDMGAYGGTPVYFPTDADDDGYSTDGVFGGTPDCDDGDATAHPGASEACDGVDEDCDGIVDNGYGNYAPWYPDEDGDGYGADVDPTYACAAPDGFVARAGDCDDTDPGVNPDAAEVCDAADVDEDCDGYADDADTQVDPASLAAWYPDADADAYGADTTGTIACDAPPETVGTAGDCDDDDATVHPDAAEVAGDGIDQDCDGADLPGDGVGVPDTGTPQKAEGGCGCTSGGRGAGLVGVLAMLLPLARRR